MWVREQAYANAMRDAALLLAQRGYDNVRAEELARATHVSVGTMYRKYGSKQGLALEVRDFAELALSQNARLRFEWVRGEPGGSFRQAFFAFWWELACWALEQPGLFDFAFLHWHPRAPQPKAHDGATRALVREVLMEGEREGALAPGGAKVGEVLLWGALTELVRSAERAQVRVSKEEALAPCEALWRALVSAEDSGPRGNGTPPPGEAPTEDSGPQGTGTPGAEGFKPGQPFLSQAATGAQSRSCPVVEALSRRSPRRPRGSSAPCPRTRSARCIGQPRVPRPRTRSGPCVRATSAIPDPGRARTCGGRGRGPRT